MKKFVLIVFIFIVLLVGCYYFLMLLQPFDVKFDNLKVSIDTFIAFFAICSTFMVGFQIYQSIDYSTRLNKIEKLLKKIENEKELMSRDINKSMYYNSYTIGQIRYYNNNDVNIHEIKNAWSAFRAYNNALKYAALGGHDFKEAYDAFGKNKIKNCIQYIRENKPIREDVNIIVSQLEDSYNIIKSQRLKVDSEEASRKLYLQLMEKEWFPYVEDIIKELNVKIPKKIIDYQSIINRVNSLIHKYKSN